MNPQSTTSAGKPRLRLLFALLFAFVISAAGALAIPAAPAFAVKTGGYPYATMPCIYGHNHVQGKGYWCSGYNWGKYHNNASAASVLSPLGYDYRNCTDFVAWKLSKVGVPPREYRGLGNGKTWGTRAKARGLTVDARPAIGAAAVSTKGSYGHVAFVTAVNGKKITVQEYNQKRDGRFGVRHGTLSKLGFKTFIRFKEKASSPSTSSSTSSVAAARDQDGRLELAAVGTDGAVYIKHQNSPDGPWSGWHSEGGKVRPSVAMETNDSGKVQAFAVGTNGKVYSKWQSSPGGSWGAWKSFGGSVQ